MESFVLLAKAGLFKNFFAKITSLSKLSLNHSRFIFSVKNERSDCFEQWQKHKTAKNHEYISTRCYRLTIYTSIAT